MSPKQLRCGNPDFYMALAIVASAIVLGLCIAGIVLLRCRLF